MPGIKFPGLCCSFSTVHFPPLHVDAACRYIAHVLHFLVAVSKTEMCIYWHNLVGNSVLTVITLIKSITWGTFLPNGQLMTFLFLKSQMTFISSPHNYINNYLIPWRVSKFAHSSFELSKLSNQETERIWKVSGKSRGPKSFTRWVQTWWPTTRKIFPLFLPSRFLPQSTRWCFPYLQIQQEINYFPNCIQYEASVT